MLREVELLICRNCNQLTMHYKHRCFLNVITQKWRIIRICIACGRAQKETANDI